MPRSAASRTKSGSSTSSSATTGPVENDTIWSIGPSACSSSWCTTTTEASGSSRAIASATSAVPIANSVTSWPRSRRIAAVSCSAASSSSAARIRNPRTSAVVVVCSPVVCCCMRLGGVSALILLQVAQPSPSLRRFLAPATRRPNEGRPNAVGSKRHLAATHPRRLAVVQAMEAQRLNVDRSDRFPSGPTDRAQEDRLLFQRYLATRDPAARDALVERFLPLARQLARRYQRAEEPLDDLIQVASLGLVKAIDRFDAEREVAFSSYAVPTILGEIKRHFRDRTWSVRVPRDLQELSLKVDRAVADLTRELHRSPSVAELGERLGQSEE